MSLPTGPQQATLELACRSCTRVGLVPVLDLGAQPLANALRRPLDIDAPERSYPLLLALCTNCGLVQITESVPPEILFGDYPYFSSVIATLVLHARDLAQRITRERKLGAESLVVEVASNDGYLLQHYRDAGVPVLGIEPARNIADAAEARGIPTRCAFFGSQLAAELANEGVRPDVIHAHNVLAHVPDLNGFVEGIATLLADRGVAVVETPYLKDLLDDSEFDTIYHEHLCYYSLTALERLFRRHGLAVEDVEHIAIHGGSLRLFVTTEERARPASSVEALLAQEESWGVDRPEPYHAFAGRVLDLKVQLRELLGSLKRDGATIAAYGAAAKGSTLLNSFGIGADTLDFVADASPHKQGLHMPGNNLPILSPDRLLEARPDYLLLLAWNFAEEILEQQRPYRDQGGRFILPVPEPRIV